MAAKQLAYRSADEMMFGSCKKPVKCGFDLEIGAGVVMPEVNYTLPPMEITEKTLDAARAQFDEMVNAIMKRCVELQVPGVVLEFEQLPALTQHPEWGAQITAETVASMERFHQEHGLKSALRATIIDLREWEKPPQRQKGELYDTMMAAFRMNAERGAHLLSIESTGGKEITDPALMEANVEALLVGLGTLAHRDMRFLWTEISRIAEETGSVPAGDTACGFANTAMILADKGFIPAVLAAVVRAMGAARSLAAFEVGAQGPHKDCGYEGPVIKAATGCSISMEGKSSACAHFSHVGNVAAAVCDLWSNESVQNVRLLSGNAPEVFAEVLAYDCRLMNQASAANQGKQFRDLLVASDAALSPNAFIITPEASFKLAEAILSEDDDYLRIRKVSLAACELMREGHAAGRLELNAREVSWLSRIEDALAAADSEQKAIESTLAQFGDAVDMSAYNL